MAKELLFLSGGGSGEDVSELNRKFVNLIKGKLLYIPIAINTEKHPYGECFKWITGELGPHGMDSSNIEMCTNLNELTSEKMDGYDGIYIGGGNTFSLLKDIKESGFDKLLIDFYKNGKPIFGGSAGAIILGKDIITASKDDDNFVGLKNTEGLDLTNDYCVWCHYNSNEDEMIAEMISDGGIKIIALSENSGVIVDSSNNLIKTDNGEVFIFDVNMKNPMY